jgi:hypothetical protein
LSIVIGNLKQDDLSHLPHFHAWSDTTGPRLALATQRSMHMKNGFTFLIGEDGADSGDLMYAFKSEKHRHRWQHIPILRPNDYISTAIDSPDEDAHAAKQLIIGGKALDGSRQLLAMFQPDDEYSANVSLSVFHDCSPHLHYTGSTLHPCQSSGTGGDYFLNLQIKAAKEYVRKT